LQHREINGVYGIKDELRPTNKAYNNKNPYKSTAEVLYFPVGSVAFPLLYALFFVFYPFIGFSLHIFFFFSGIFFSFRYGSFTSIYRYAPFV